MIVIAAMAGCARNGPPAPLVMLGAPPPAVPSDAPRAAPRAPVVTAPPASIIVKNEPAKPLSAETPKSEPPKNEPAKSEAAEISPLPPPSAPQERAPHPNEIVVGKGETLYTIAQRYDVPVRAIIDANHIEPPFLLAPGTRLTLPQERSHTVQAGDTLYSISRRYGVEVSTLAGLNRIEAPFAIRVGQALSLPASIAPPEPVVAASPPDRSMTAPAQQSLPELPPPSKPASDQARAETAPPSKPHTAPVRVFAWPLEGRVIAPYGTAPSGTHNDGINIAARAGEPIRAADAGRVAYAGNELRGYGNLVLIKHAAGYMTAYAHNGKLLVKRGEVVKRGQEIAKAGATGTVNAPQLHFEIRQGTRALDPTNHLPSLRASAD